MEWTQEMPTEKGIYWTRLNGGNPECQIVEVCRRYILFMGTGQDYDLDYTMADTENGIIWHWYGPLIAPEYDGGQA